MRTFLRHSVHWQLHLRLISLLLEVNVWEDSCGSGLAVQVSLSRCFCTGEPIKLFLYRWAYQGVSVQVNLSRCFYQTPWRCSQCCGTLSSSVFSSVVSETRAAVVVARVAPNPSRAKDFSLSLTAVIPAVLSRKCFFHKSLDESTSLAFNCSSAQGLDVDWQYVCIQMFGF